MAPILEVRDLVTRFYTFDGVVHALNGVSFDLQAGETLAIVGESGSGKSVTMMSLLHLLPMPPARIEGGSALFHDDSGTIDLLKLNKAEISRVRGGRIGFIFQDALSALNPVMTVGRQIAEPLERHLGLGHEQCRRRVVELLEKVGIPGAKQRYRNYPHQFSGGMRQRVMIAVAMACNPKIVIADEPTTALDVTIQAQILALIADLQRSTGMSLVFITHDLGVIAEICDRVVVMYAGRVVESAPVTELFARPCHPYTRGLLASMPRLDLPPKARLTTIRGMVPDLGRMPPGCRFHNRCDETLPHCAEQPPQAVQVAPDHRVCCHRYNGGEESVARETAP